MEILSYEEGLLRKKELSEKYNRQMDITCLNSKEFKLGKSSNEFKQLFHKVSEFIIHFEKRVVFCRSEFHTEESPFYETFFFCTDDELDFFHNQITDYGLIVLYISDTAFYKDID